MCGILGLVAPRGREPGVSDQQAVQMRDRMRHRGPDGAGLHRRENVVLGHRRLAIRDVEAGAQPWIGNGGRWLLVYNGELYNDGELRDALRQDGASFHTHCDTETVLRALETWDLDGIPRLRGMYAFGAYDTQTHRLVLARDPLGIKPLFFARWGYDFAFASEIPALLAHPQASARPNAAVVSSYLTTLRPTLGHETMFADVYTLGPGEVAVIDATQEDDVQVLPWWSDPAPQTVDLETSIEAVRIAMADSVRRHLVSDVPTCLLLSGGLDSAIIAHEARPHVRGPLRTWCAADPTDCGGDAAHAQQMAAALGSEHHLAEVNAGTFGAAWTELIDTLGLPVSTPNQAAILAVSRDLKAHATVALSGEGADELFAGYAAPLLSGMDAMLATKVDATTGAGRRYLSELEAQYGTPTLGGEVEHYLRCTGWVRPAEKASLLQPDVSAAIEHDLPLRRELARQFGLDRGLRAEERLLRVHRRINLTGLLQRLDACTMLASVEGRTPFADAELASLAMRIPMAHKLQVTRHADGGRSSGQRLVLDDRARTKVVLREAWAAELPAAIVGRPKVSFPLPFEGWMASSPPVDSAAVSAVFQPDALRALAVDGAAHWQTTWPVWNVVRWLDRWCTS